MRDVICVCVSKTLLFHLHKRGIESRPLNIKICEHCRAIWSKYMKGYGGMVESEWGSGERFTTLGRGCIESAFPKGATAPTALWTSGPTQRSAFDMVPFIRSGRDNAAEYAEITCGLHTSVFSRQASFFCLKWRRPSLLIRKRDSGPIRDDVRNSDFASRWLYLFNMLRLPGLAVDW